MRVTMATEPAKPGQPNEDFVGATPTGVVLLDGAGALGLETGCIHGVAWYAHHLGGNLLAHIHNEDQALSAILGDAIAITADQHRSTCDLSHPGTPSATVVLVRDTGDRIEYAVLADSVLVVQHSTGEVEAICDDREGHVGTRYRSSVETAPNGTAEHDRAIMAYIEGMRTHRNQPGGFWVAAAEPSAAAEALTGSWPEAEIDSVALLSDGASRLVDRFHLSTWEGLVQLIDERGPSEPLIRVRDAERSDLDGSRWPRGKAFDDATIAHCKYIH